VDQPQELFQSRRLMTYDFVRIIFPSFSLLLSTPTCYRTMRGDRRLTPSAMNNTHKYSILNSLIYIVTCSVWLYTGFGFVSRFIDHLYTPLGTTSNYSAIANLHNLQINASNTKSSTPCTVFTRRFLATASNSGDSSVSRSQFHPLQTPVQNCI
jgi:hypothetical protein